MREVRIGVWLSLEGGKEVAGVCGIYGLGLFRVGWMVDCYIHRFDNVEWDDVLGRNWGRNINLAFM